MLLQNHSAWARTGPAASWWLLFASLSLALSLWLCWPARPVQAAGSDIKVLDIREEVNFPGGLTFTLTAEGDQEIVEVRMLYRALDRAI